MVIKQTSFKHGWYYHYRVHNFKTKDLTNGLTALKDFLYNMFDSCPHSYFERGPRSSSLKFKIPDIDVQCIIGHEVSQLAKVGLKVNAERYKGGHPQVQVFMLENDKSTLAMEIPLWLEPKELENFKELFEIEEPLTGHIDILRIEDGKIWVWDYKPNADKEKYASTQVYFYALMLSKRTKIPLENFRCGYFDDSYAYIFKPEEIQINSFQGKLNNF